jgi:hypothetical protein
MARDFVTDLQTGITAAVVDALREIRLRDDLTAAVTRTLTSAGAARALTPCAPARHQGTI